MLFVQLLSRVVQLLRHISSERRHTDFCRDYSFHPIGKCEGRYVGLFSGGHSVNREYSRKFVYPFAFS